MRTPIQPYNLVLRIAAKMLIPIILMFALYVLFHGESGPGGGFQAGVIFAAGFILYALVFGMATVRAVAPDRVLRALAGFGVLLYIGVGIAALFSGGNYLDYSVLAEDAVEGQHLGIFLVELGIGITVTADDYDFFRLRRTGGARVSTLVGHYNYWIVIYLMMAGFYVVMVDGNLVKKIVGLNIFQASVFLLFISMGKVEGGTAPILTDSASVYSNPLPHVLILTAIVVGVATTALALALVVRINEAYHTVEEDEIHKQERSF